MGSKTNGKNDGPYMCFLGVMAGSGAYVSQGKGRPSQTRLVSSSSQSSELAAWLRVGLE